MPYDRTFNDLNFDIENSGESPRLTKNYINRFPQSTVLHNIVAGSNIAIITTSLIISMILYAIFGRDRIRRIRDQMSSSKPRPKDQDTYMHDKPEIKDTVGYYTTDRLINKQVESMVAREFKISHVEASRLNLLWDDYGAAGNTPRSTAHSDIAGLKRKYNRKDDRIKNKVYHTDAANLEATSHSTGLGLHGPKRKSTDGIFNFPWVISHQVVDDSKTATHHTRQIDIPGLDSMKVKIYAMNCSYGSGTGNIMLEANIDESLICSIRAGVLFIRLKQGHDIFPQIDVKEIKLNCVFRWIEYPAL